MVTLATAALAQQRIDIGSGWRLADAAQVHDGGGQIARPGYLTSQAWRPATVPGTVLTSLVNDGIYPEPTYGENNRPESIPESLNKAHYWYRCEFGVPASYAGRHIWLELDGVNYAATVWVNGTRVGEQRGAFRHTRYDISTAVVAGQAAALAIEVSPQPHPGQSHEHTIRNGLGSNGGETALDGPTFLSTIGWDWLPAIRDRDTGIWQPVHLSTTGNVRVTEPLVTTDLPLPRTDEAKVEVSATVENLSDAAVTGTLHGTFEGVQFSRTVTLAAHARERVQFKPADTPALDLHNPRLWWPNGYGPQNLYHLKLAFNVGNAESDATTVQFGVRKIEYSVADSENLTLSVNGVRVFVRGGDWGLDEALKRIPRQRLEAQIRMHHMAHMNLIRNWVGQSTSDDFYDLADQYGLLLWDEFFQPNPSDGPNPTDMDTYMANVRDKILRYRNHPSIAVWCARNEGYPPENIDKELRKLMAELEPTRRYQPSSTDGAGVRSAGPYFWRTPREYYKITDDYFKTETGSVSIPTLESVHGMLPQKDWETINDDWAEHDLARGAQQGDKYPLELAERYGKLQNLADFVRKGQLANYEAYRSMYEGRNAVMFHPTTGIITWMSHPAQPSFVWQLYHYDLEPNASLYAVQTAAEPVHIQLNQATNAVQVVNNHPQAFAGTATLELLQLDGSSAAKTEVVVKAEGSRTTTLGDLAKLAGAEPKATHFVALTLNENGKQISRNIYWVGPSEHADDLTALNQMPAVELNGSINCTTKDGRRTVSVTLTNPTTHVALLTHVQLRRANGERVLPYFADRNYVTLSGGESTTITIDAAEADLHGQDALVTVDGWNVTVQDASNSGARLSTNREASPAYWPTTGLPFQTEALR